MRLSSRDRAQATVAYADIFDYPLTRDEVQLWSIGSEVIAIPNTDYVTLPGRSQLVAVRMRRERLAKEKWEKAARVASYFRYIPTVMLVGVTGGLSMNNAEKSDDIDLFFITRQGTVWISRLLVTMCAHILGVRRIPNDTSVTNKICLNMFMADDALALSVKEYDLFAAHEILQMRPLWERNGACYKFLQANSWVKDFLPNAWKERIKSKQFLVRRKRKENFLFSIFCLLFTIFEPTARLLQLWYMRKRRSSEIIESGVLRFHPQDARVWVYRKYALRCKNLNLPLDKIFYHR